MEREKILLQLPACQTIQANPQQRWDCSGTSRISGYCCYISVCWISPSDRQTENPLENLSVRCCWEGGRKATLMFRSKEGDVQDNPPGHSSCPVHHARTGRSALISWGALPCRQKGIFTVQKQGAFLSRREGFLHNSINPGTGEAAANIERFKQAVLGCNS